MTGDQTLLELDGRLNINGQRGGNRGKRERIRANCTWQGTWVNLGGGGRGGPKTSFDGNSSKLNVKGQSLLIS